MFSFLKKVFQSIVNSLKSLYIIYNYLSFSLYRFLKVIFNVQDLIDTSIEDAAEEKKFLNVVRFVDRETFFSLIINVFFFKVDKRELKSNLNYFWVNNKNNYILPRYFYRNKNYTIQNTINTNVNMLDSTKNHLWFGLKSLWKSTRYWLLSIILFITSIYFLSFIRVLPVNTVLFQWFALGMFSYWLISGFVFFIKKYRFTRFTSSIQRFWRRSYILFWLIESCLLVVFIYLTLNSTQESSYMLDQINVLKTHLFSWRAFLPKLLLNTILVILGYLLLLNIKWNIFKKNISFILIITILLTYMLWVEFYQIYHVSNFYSNLFWSYDIDEKLWSLESDVRRTRIVNHYVMILYILKFWHIVFIYAFWIFFVLRVQELDRIRYPLYSANFQNFIILYIMAWLFMYPWIKVVSSKFMSTPYFWFYVNNREIGLRVFFNDIKLVIFGLENIFKFDKLFFFKKNAFYYWTDLNSNNNFEGFRKHTIKSIFLKETVK